MPSYGVVTRTTEAVDRAAFDRAFYEAKDVTGRTAAPLPDAVNMVSCFGDTAAVDADPSLAAVDAAGEPATRDRRYFDWSYVCPTHEGYRADLLATIEACADANPDVRLDDVGFPRQGYCRCERCDRRFAASDHADRDAWRETVITDFVRQATDRIPGRTALTLYPDPYPGHLSRRAGLALEALAPLVDEFVVPLYDTAYGTTYWLEALASGFRDALEGRLAVELYAVGVEVDALVDAASVAGAYADAVLFAYDADTALAAVERLGPDP